MKRGATIQLTRMLKRIWIQIARSRKTWWSDSYWTLQRMGYIMTSRPTAGGRIISHVERGTVRISLTDGNRHADELALLQGRADVVDEVAQDDPDGHGEEDPDGQEAIEEP